MFFMSTFHVYSKSLETQCHVKEEYPGDQRG